MLPRLTIITAALAILTIGGTANADSTCLCSVSYVIRPCSGTLTKAKGRSARDSYNCHKASTKLQHTKNPSIKVADLNACKKACKDNGQKRLDSIISGGECKRRPGQHVVTKWNAFGGGSGSNLLDMERKGKCPGKEEASSGGGSKTKGKKGGSGAAPTKCTGGKLLSVDGTTCVPKCNGSRKEVKAGQCVCKRGFVPKGRNTCKKK